MKAIEPLQARLETSVLMQRWRGLPPRDRLAMILLGLFLLLVVLYLGLWRPAQHKALSARDDYQQQRELNLYLHSHAAAARALQSKPQTSIDPARLQGFVTTSAAEHGLAIERLDNEGEGGLLVNLQPAGFAELLRWFVSLEEQGVRIDEAGLDRADRGRVTARLTLRVAP